LRRLDIALGLGGASRSHSSQSGSSTEWIIVGCLNQTSSDWIVTNVLDDGVRIIFVSKDAVEVPRLPESPPDERPRDIRCSLLRGAHKDAQIRVLRLSFHQEVKMIGHEAVRENVKVIARRNVRKLQPHGVDDSRICEAANVRKCTYRQEIAATPNVRTILKTSWSHEAHSADPAP